MSSPSPAVPPSKSRLPAWVWACTFCAILPVLGVILLAVLVTPTLRGFRRAAQERAGGESCMSNVQQLGTALSMYVQDYDDRYPSNADWMDTTYPYVKNQSIYQCPSVKAKNRTANGYAFNSRLSGLESKKIKTPAVTGMVYDSSNLSRNASDAMTSLPDPARHSYRDPSSGTAPKDEQVNMMGYADGHVKALPQGSPLPASVPSRGNK